MGEATSQKQWKQTTLKSFTDRHPSKEKKKKRKVGGAEQENEMQSPGFDRGSSLAYKQAVDN